MNALTELRKKKEDPLKVDERAVEVFEGLRDFVDNLNSHAKIAHRNGSFKQLDPNQVYTKEYDGFEIGYNLMEMPGGKTFRRTVFLRTPGEAIEQIPHEQIEPVLAAAYLVFTHDDVAAGLSACVIG
jgi:hypothetical protein